MKRLPVIFKHQITGFLTMPAFYSSAAIFIAASILIGMPPSLWINHDPRDMHFFFQYHPWLYLLLTPVLSIQRGPEASGDDIRDFFNTLPLTTGERLIGKFLAAWSLVALVLLTSVPLALTVNYLTIADNFVIASQYFASWLLAGSYLAVGSFIGSMTHKRIMVFMLTLSLLLLASGLSSTLDALDHQAPVWLIDSLIALSPLLRFAAIDKGVMTLQDSLYFASTILAFLTATYIVLNHKNG